jgi:hypothetical protein
MLWEAGPLPEIAERLAALGVESRAFAPCANRPEVGDWLTVMKANLRVLHTSVTPRVGEVRYRRRRCRPTSRSRSGC